MSTEIDGVNGIIKNTTSDGDITIKGNDGGSEISAVTFDMSAAGTATFNHDVKLGDNSKALFGAGDDLEIYHDGSNSYVKDAGTGNLRLEGTDIRIANSGGTGDYIRCTNGGATDLLHNGSVKISTTSAGIDVVGKILHTGGTASSTSDLTTGGIHFHDSSTSAGDIMPITFTPTATADRARAGIGFISQAQDGSAGFAADITFYTRGAADGSTLGTSDERMRITKDGKVGIGATTPAQQLSILNDQNTDTAMRISNGTAGTAARSTIFLDVDGGGAQLMAVNASFSTSGPYIADNVTFVSDTAMTNGMTIGTRSSDGNAHLRFYTQDSQKLKINSTGGLINTMPINDVYGIDNQITPSSGNLYAQKNTFENRSPDDNTSSFYWGNDNVTARFGVYSDGDVQNHDNSYGAFSDERIKQDIRDANSQWDDIKAVKVRNFKKKDDVRQYGDKAWEQIGVIAQEIEAAGMDKLIKHSNPSAGDIISSSEFGTLWTADDPETQDAVEEVLYTADDPETQDVLYTADDVETQDGFYTEEDELPEGVEVGDVKPAAKSVGDVKEYATASVGDIKIEAEPSTAQIGEVKEIKAQVKKIGYSVLYMKAIKALQEAQTRIETLETKVAALEG